MSFRVKPLKSYSKEKERQVIDGCQPVKKDQVQKRSGYRLLKGPEAKYSVNDLSALGA